ncbi:Isopentenyl-diphosphate [Venturia nashicola]|uniref:Isopentenyl-diphosphate n=1 Tax=Venturia nashicola TaxID=86259 RepID=A0A4Z1P8Z2_9PEZI|nr:Isopentenyl-diphosphate [Venturia nashicola]
MTTLQFEAHHGAPKRSNSGREITYVFPETRANLQHYSMQNDLIPQDVVECFHVLRKYSFRDIYRWLKLDRQHELNRNAVQPSPQRMSNMSSMSDPRMSQAQRLSIASTHGSSRASSVFSAGAKRISVASTNTNYSHISDPGMMGNWEATLPVGPPQPHVQVAHAVPLSHKKSATLINSPSKASRNSVASQVRPTPRQRESDVEAKKKYFCTSCNKGFARKYDWKVHEQRYHEQQTQYPCPDCNQILFAETLFKSHHRDAHGCQDCPHAKTVAKDVDVRRRRTAWGCGFCSEILDDWEKRCDHVAGHYDGGVKREEWDHSKVIIGLLRQPEVDQEWQSLLLSRHGHTPTDLGLRFSKEATGRSHGENAFQLQDLLEFGSTTRDISTIVQLAYEHGYRRPMANTSSPVQTDNQNSSLLSPPFSVTHDTIMESPIVESVKHESPVNYMPANSSPLESFELPFNQNMAYQTPAESRMSSVGPVADWTTNVYQQPQLIQQQQQQFQQMQQMQQNNRMSVSMAYDKALPPIPPEMHEEHSSTPRPEHIVHQQQHIQPQDLHNNFDQWSLVGSTLVDDQSIPHGLYDQHHF